MYVAADLGEWSREEEWGARESGTDLEMSQHA